MRVLITLVSLAVIAISVCFIYVALVQPAQFSFLGMQFGRLDKQPLAKLDDLDRIEADLNRSKIKVSELLSDQRSLSDRLEKMDKEYIALVKLIESGIEPKIARLSKEVSQLSSYAELTEKIDEIETKYIEYTNDLRAEVERFTVSILENMSYINMFPHDLVAVMGAGARDPLITIDQQVSYIKNNQPDIFNYPGIYICPQPDNTSNTWNLVYGDYTSSAAAERIRFLTEELHKEVKQRPAYPYPRSKYHNKNLHEVCIDGKEWANMGASEKIDIICKLDNATSPLDYCVE